MALKYYIIDGQHTVKAAEILKMSVIVFIMEKETMENEMPRTLLVNHEDFDIFMHLPGNREPQEKDVMALVNSISTFNLLKYNPVIAVEVDENASNSVKSEKFDFALKAVEKLNSTMKKFKPEDRLNLLATQARMGFAPHYKGYMELDNMWARINRSSYYVKYSLLIHLMSVTGSNSRVNKNKNVITRSLNEYIYTHINKERENIIINFCKRMTETVKNIDQKDRALLLNSYDTINGNLWKGFANVWRAKGFNTELIAKSFATYYHMLDEEIKTETDYSAKINEMVTIYQTCNKDDRTKPNGKVNYACN